MHGGERRAQTWWGKALDKKKRTGASPELASAVVERARCLEWALSKHQQQTLENFCLYGSFGSSGAGHLVIEEKPLRQNMIATGVDALTSEMVQNSPRAMWIARGGTWGDHRTAKKLTSWSDDVDQEQDLDELRPQYYRDGFIDGTGWLYTYREGDEQRTCRAAPWNVLMDDRNSGDSIPRELFYRRHVDRQHLAAIAKEMPGYTGEVGHVIEHAAERSNSIWAFGGDEADTSDLIEVWEAWRLPSRKDGDDGVHIIAIGGAVLLCEPYKRTKYPLVAYRPVKPTRGFYGISLVERAGPMQLAFNDALVRCDEAQEFHAHGVLVGPSGTMDQFKAHWTNQAGTVAEHPNPGSLNWMAPEPMPQSAYMTRDWYKDAILEVFAVNEMQAQGTKPSGLDSGKALRTFVDTGSRRYIDPKRAADRSHANYMLEAVEVNRQIAELYPKHRVIYKRHGVPVEIPWEKLNPNDRHLRIVPFPASALPNDPAGRLQALEEMRKDGAIEQEDYWALMDMPDLETARDEHTAPIEFIRYQIDTMLDEGKPVQPWPTSPLERGIKICNATMMKEAMNGAGDEQLDLLRRWIKAAKRELSKAADAMAPPPMPAMDPMAAAMGGGMPPGPPMDPATAGMGPPMDPTMGGMPGPGPVGVPPLPMTG